jgi:deoxyribose-phosphate aldolase
VSREERNVLAMRVREFAKTVDHTLLKPEATEQEIVSLCKEASHYHFAAVCIPPSYVPLAARELRGADVKVATVISFPFGYEPTAVKIAAVREAVTRGASELDVVMKVILETAYLSDKMKRLATQIVAASGADFVKTSTGFGPVGATPEDVALLREEAPEGLAVKASGGISSLRDALDILNAGASRLGMSASVAVMEEAEDGGLQE